MVDRAALAVESHDEFIAWASYERWPGRDEAEAAFMVDDAHQGEGIATLLLEHLAAIARSNGIERFTAEVLGDNRAMLACLRQGGMAPPAPLRLGRRRSRLGVDPHRRIPRQRRSPRATRRLPRRGTDSPAAGGCRDRRLRTARIGRRRRLASSSRTAWRHRCTPSTLGTDHAPRPPVPSFDRRRSPRRGLPGHRRRPGVAARRRPSTLHRQADARRRVDHRRRRTERRRAGALVRSRHAATDSGSSDRRAWALRRRGPTPHSRPPSCGSRSPSASRDLDAVRVARQLAAAQGARPRSRHLVVHLTRRQERHLGQRPPAVLGARRPTPT